MASSDIDFAGAWRLLTLSQRSYDAMAAGSEDRFVASLVVFIESEFPERASPDGQVAREIARTMITQCAGYGLGLQESVLRYTAAWLGYICFDPPGYQWIDDLMRDPELDEEYRILFMEHRLFGRSVWGDE